jgi:hypothetical protein
VYEIWKFDLKTGLWEEQLMRCYYCGRLIDDISGAHLEHKTPLVYGGGNELSNLCLACAHCNLQKGKRSEAEYLTLIILAEQEAGERVMPTPDGFDENLPLDPKALTSNLR